MSSRRETEKIEEESEVQDMMEAKIKRLSSNDAGHCGEVLSKMVCKDRVKGYTSLRPGQ